MFDYNKEFKWCLLVMGMEKDHWILMDCYYSDVAVALGSISLQAIDNRHFTIDSGDLLEPTYVAIERGKEEERVDVYVRTRRPIKRDEKCYNLEPCLARVLDKFKAFD